MQCDPKQNIHTQRECRSFDIFHDERRQRYQGNWSNSRNLKHKNGQSYLDEKILLKVNKKDNSATSVMEFQFSAML